MLCRNTWAPRISCWAALLAFFFTLVPLESFHWDETGESGEAAVVAEHQGDCPDGLPDGVPCSSSCACLCCPGHVRSLPVVELAMVRSPLELTGDLFERARRIHPKEIVFTGIGAAKLKRIDKYLNDQPRKCLGWMTPREKMTRPITPLQRRPARL